MKGQFNWVTGHYRRNLGEVPNTQTAMYRLSNLMDRRLVPRDEGAKFLEAHELTDFVWQATWGEDYDTPDELLEQRFDEADGFVIFVHGWTGNHRVWEKLPSMVVEANRRLVAISIDHNGFGNSRFSTPTPKLEVCNPPAAMRTLQAFVDMMRFRRQSGDPRPKVINFVGHSMGGATLFYLNPVHWRYGEETRYALAPALLLEDDLHQVFYTALGTGINILQRVPVLEVLERAIQPRILDVLCNGASKYVKEEHNRQYKDTPRGVTGATFEAMGRLRDSEIARRWDTFRVMLGHRDNLVSLSDMINLLGHLEFPVRNMRVVPGSHYMFSVALHDDRTADREGVYQHTQSREVLIQDILELHERALDMQRTGKRYGGFSLG